MSHVHSASIRININFDDSINENEIILCHEKSLNRALANVLRNAISFADSQCLIMVSKFDQQLIIAINDDGPGLDGLDINRIFEPFYKQNNIKRSSGYGLGLAIAQTITRKQNGCLDIIQGALKGACFRFNLPLIK